MGKVVFVSVLLLVFVLGVLLGMPVFEDEQLLWYKQTYQKVDGADFCRPVASGMGVYDRGSFRWFAYTNPEGTFSIHLDVPLYEEHLAAIEKLEDSRGNTWFAYLAETLPEPEKILGPEAKTAIVPGNDWADRYCGAEFKVCDYEKGLTAYLATLGRAVPLSFETKTSY